MLDSCSTSIDRSTRTIFLVVQDIYWKLSDKKRNIEVQFLMVMASDLELDNKFWLKSIGTREGINGEGNGPIQHLS